MMSSYKKSVNYFLNFSRLIFYLAQSDSFKYIFLYSIPLSVNALAYFAAFTECSS